jgi:phosphopantothenoylcysteine decarboxylase / phosphopantothenate---cysteine ligase
VTSSGAPQGPGRIRALITAGATREPLDPVRFISNASTGAQGALLVAEALARGWEVDLVHGHLEVLVAPEARRHPALTARDMLDACRRLHSSCDVLIAAAAVSDYTPREASPRKRKRDASGWTLELVPTEDILLALRESKGKRVHAGFALETEDMEGNALRKLEAKGLDWIVANGPEAIGGNASRYVILGLGGERRDLGIATKAEVARALLDALESGIGR